MRPRYQIMAPEDPRPGHETAHPTALKAFRDEDDLWGLYGGTDEQGRPCFEVRRGETVKHRFYQHRAAQTCLNDVGLTAAIMAAVAVAMKQPLPRSVAMARRYR